MDVRIFVETVFEVGEVMTHDVGQICRPLEDAGPANLGLHLAETKRLLKQLQETVLRDQIEELLRAKRNCSDCGKRRAIHDDRGRSLDTLYGRIRVKALRLHQCTCKGSADVENLVLQSPLVDLFPVRATLELQHLQAELGSRHSLREAARLIDRFLPCAPQLNTTVRNRLGRIAETLCYSKVDERNKNSLLTSAPLTVFLDGVHIRCRSEYQKRNLDVLVG